ncbi:MAG: hypothetical protein ABIR62_09025 [Dokdonella sp.]|uniref:hypothetical protein n=1 Tax=Dokdonella sp. TaxID=2291710 RepID=UPI003265169E
MATQKTDPGSPTSEEINDGPEDIEEEIDVEAADDFGDETQSNEERAALEGMEQESLIDPRGEDDAAE